MPTGSGQRYLTTIFPSKAVTDSMCPNKDGLLFSIGGFILIAGNIIFVVKLLPTSSIIFLKKLFTVWCISHVVITHCPSLSDVCNQQRI